jgi:hypothetical protein
MQPRPKLDTALDTAALYDTDFVLWCHEQARLVREGRFAELDMANVAEELDSMGRSDRRQLRSRLEVVIAHLLKWKFQPGARSSIWRGTLQEQRMRIADLIEDSPSLAPEPARIVAECYRAARLLAASETGIDYTLFPDTCPFSTAEILDPAFLPIEPDRIPPTDPTPPESP